MSNGEKNSEKTLKDRPVSGRNGQPVPVNPNGRPKGQPNKVTIEYKEAVINLLNYAAPKMVEWLDQIDSPERRLEIILKFGAQAFPTKSEVKVDHTVTHKSESVSKLDEWLEGVAGSRSNSKDAEPLPN